MTRRCRNENHSINLADDVCMAQWLRELRDTRTRRGDGTLWHRCEQTAGAGHRPVDPQLERIEKLPLVRGLAPLNRLVIPSVLQTDADLRTAAAKLRADILLVYTLDTRFEEKSRATPLAVVTLGA